MSHENSVTVRGPDGQYYNISGITGEVLKGHTGGPFPTKETAVWRAKMRSKMTPPMPELGDLSALMELQHSSLLPNKNPYMDQWQNPEPTEYGPLDDWSKDVYTARR